MQPTCMASQRLPRRSEWRILFSCETHIMLCHARDPGRLRKEYLNGVVEDDAMPRTVEMVFEDVVEDARVFLEPNTRTVTKFFSRGGWMLLYQEPVVLGSMPIDVAKRLLLVKVDLEAHLTYPVYGIVIPLLWNYRESVHHVAWRMIEPRTFRNFKCTNAKVKSVEQFDFHTEKLKALVTFPVGRQLDLNVFMLMATLTEALTKRLARNVPDLTDMPHGYGEVHVCLTQLFQFMKQLKPLATKSLRNMSVSTQKLKLEANFEEEYAALTCSAKELAWFFSEAACRELVMPLDEMWCNKRASERRKRSKEHRRHAELMRSQAQKEKHAASEAEKEARARAEATEAMERALAIAEAECATAGVAAASERIAQALRKHHDKCDPAVRRAAAARRAQWKRTPPPPDELVCPITLELMRDPVVLAGDGKVYEREAIEAWLAKELVSPMTGLALGDATLSPDEASRAKADEYRASRRSKPKPTVGNEPPSTFPAPSHASPAT